MKNKVVPTMIMINGTVRMYIKIGERFISLPVP